MGGDGRDKLAQRVRADHFLIGQAVAPKGINACAHLLHLRFGFTDQELPMCVKAAIVADQALHVVPHLERHERRRHFFARAA